MDIAFFRLSLNWFIHCVKDGKDSLLYTVFTIQCIYLAFYEYYFLVQAVSFTLSRGYWYLKLLVFGLLFQQSLKAELGFVLVFFTNKKFPHTSKVEAKDTD